jgi:polyphosphate kinase 2 (PPK2 family)
MFEAAELGQRIPKEEYKRRVPKLRAELLDVQQQLTRARFPVIVVFAGVDGAGKGETVNLLNAWMIRAGPALARTANRRTRRVSVRSTGGIGGTCRQRDAWVCS